MSITILPQEQLEQQSTSNIVRTIPLLFYPSPLLLYTRRYERLQQLAKENPFGDYLEFCANIVKKQLTLLKQKPVQKDLASLLNSTLTPLSTDNNPLTFEWQNYFNSIINDFPAINKQISLVIQDLQQNNQEQLQNKASLLLKGSFSQVNNNESLFIWAALSLYYVQLASQIKRQAVSENNQQHWTCPICNSLPIASVIHIGNNIGLRYLHCSLCECEWYVPRVKCTSCDDLQHVHYFSLDEELSLSQSECCDNCHSYLKIFNQDRDPHFDVIADDIDSLVLDMRTEAEGFSKSGLNPYLFANDTK